LTKKLYGGAEGVGDGVGFGVGFGVGLGVGLGVGDGVVGVGVGSGVGFGVGEGVGQAAHAFNDVILSAFEKWKPCLTWPSNDTQNDVFPRLIQLDEVKVLELQKVLLLPIILKLPCGL
jgi:hypothetical protein